MSLLHVIVGALSATGSGSGGGGTTDIVADWADITVTSSSTGGSASNAAQTITFTGGGTRQLRINLDNTVGTLSYKKNSGAEIAISNGALITVSSGDTISFKFAVSRHSAVVLVSVVDFTFGAEIDSFVCSFDYTGGGGLPP